MSDEVPLPRSREEAAKDTIEVELQKLELAEAEWQRLERSQGGQLLQAAWTEIKPIATAIAGQGAAAVFGALAERISNR